MTGIAAALVLLSAFTHAGWNLLGKRSHPSAAFFLVANAVGMALLVPALLVLAARLADVPAPVWLALAATGLFQALYYVCLAAAYRAGDMSLAYPLARSLPVLLTTLFIAATRGAGSFSVSYLAGCALVIAGILALSLGSGGRGRLRDRLVSACTLLAASAAVGTTGYSLIDGSALAAMRAGGLFGASEAALLYLAMEAVTSTLWMGAYVLVRRDERRELARTLRQARGPAALMGLGIYVTYGLVLVAMSFARNVGYIVAFRQVSVPLGALLAVLVFRERLGAARAAGLAATSAGLALVALG